MPDKAHLTNYAINKDAADFKITDQDIEDGTSSKRTLDTVYKRLSDDGVDVNLLKLKIADLIIKTLISCQPDLLHNYRTCQPNDRTFDMCFEVLGFDVLIDADTKPWLLEVNQAPSFQTDSPLDLRVKKAVIKDTFQILGVNEANRQKNLDRIIRDRELKKMHKQSTLFWNQMRGEEFAREIDERRVHQLNNLGGFYKVFPVEDHDQTFSGGLFRNSISKKAKSYYSKFEKNGNMSVAASTGHGILQNIIKQKKHAQRNAVESNALTQVSASSQILPSAQIQPQPHGVRMHNITTNSSMFNMSQNQTFQMMGDGIAQSNPLHKIMAQSGSSIKLRGIGGRQSNVYQEGGQAVKQKVFSLPKDVNGVASITQARPLIEHQNSQAEYIQAHESQASANINGSNMIGPLVLNQVVQQGKRHVSVDPNTGKHAKGSPALIPNGMNNGRVYRRQSSDPHQQLNLHPSQQQQQQQHLFGQQHALQLTTDPQQILLQGGQHSQSMTRQDKANAWVRRMRFVMAQATQQNYVAGDGGQISPILQGTISDNTQLSNGATIHQVITQMQGKVNGANHHQVLIQSKQDNNHQQMPSQYNSGGGSGNNSKGFNSSAHQMNTPANLIQHSISTIQRKGDAEITLSDLKGSNAAQHGNAVQQVRQASNLVLEKQGSNANNNNNQRQKNNSNVSIQAVKQIKAEAFKCYLSQATQLQQKILEHSMQQQVAADSAGNTTVVSDFSALRPLSQENTGRDNNSAANRGGNKGTNRSKVSEMNSLPGGDMQQINHYLLPNTSPAGKKHMTPQVLKSHISPDINIEFPNSDSNVGRTSVGKIQKHQVGKSAGPNTNVPQKNNSMLPEVQNSLTNTVHSTANPSTQNLHQSVKFPRTNLKYSESQQVPSENQQKIYWLDNQKNHQLELDQRSHPALQLHLSPVNKGVRGGGGVADFNHRKTVQGQPPIAGQQVKASHDLQSPTAAQQIYRNMAVNNGPTGGAVQNGNGANHPGSYRWSNFGEHVINAEMLQQTHHRVQDLRHFEIQQQSAATSAAAASAAQSQQKSLSQSQMQHFQKKSASVPAGQATIQRIAANTTGMMPSIHKQQVVAFPNLKNQNLQEMMMINQQQIMSQQPNNSSPQQQKQHTSKVKVSSAGGATQQTTNTSTNMKNYIQIMQNTNGEQRNQLLLVSNPDLMVKKGQNQQHDLSLPSPVTTSVKPKEVRTTGSTASLHKKTYSMPAASATPVQKRSLEGRTVNGGTATGILPVTTNNSNSIIISAQPN